MSEDTSAYTVTLKGGKGYEDSWIVVRGDSPQDVSNKLNGIGEVVAATTSAASLFHAANVAGAGGIVAPPQAAPVQQVQQIPQQQFVPQVVSSPPGWAAPQQNQAPQGATGPRGERLHPEGKQCSMCGSVLMEKKTQTGKAKWQCDQWRWGNGNPNGHDMEWIS